MISVGMPIWLRESCRVARSRGPPSLWMGLWMGVRRPCLVAKSGLLECELETIMDPILHQASMIWVSKTMVASRRAQLPRFPTSLMGV